MRKRPYGFEIYLVNAKTMRTIAQIFVAFSEKLNFKQKLPSLAHLITYSQTCIQAQVKFNFALSSCCVFTEYLSIFLNFFFQFFKKFVLIVGGTFS